MRVLFWILFPLIAVITGCQDASVLPGNIHVKIKESKPVITKVVVTNDQLIVSGSNLNDVNVAKISGSLNHQFQIESKTSNTLVLNAKAALNILVGQSLNLIVSNASAAATFPITFELQNGQVQAIHLDDMGASAGQVLRFNGSTWAPASLSSSQIYAGTYNASTNSPDLLALAEPAGTYYIVTTGGSQNFGSGSVTLNVGDWVIFDGSNWDTIAIGGNTVSSFNGRTGIVVPASGDYNWDQLSKTAGKLTGSQVSEIADVDVVGIQDGDVLQWNTTTSKWEADALPAPVVTAGSITNTQIASSAVNSSNIVDGTIVDADVSASASIAQSKIAGLVAALSAKENSLPTGGTTSQYFRGDKTLASFGASVLGVQLAGYTTGTATPLLVSDTIPAAIGKLDAYIAALGTAQSNYVLRNGTSAMTGNLQMGTNRITGLGAPAADSDAATKEYVDDAVAGMGGGGGTPAGIDGAVQIKNGVAFQGVDEFVWDDTNTSLEIGGADTQSNTLRLNLHSQLTGNRMKMTNSITGGTNLDGFDIGISSLDVQFTQYETGKFAFRHGGTEDFTILANGNVGIGVIAPTTKLDVNGQIKIAGGSPGAGKVLTSDADGLASWQTPAAGGVTSVSGTAPISVTGTTTPVVSLAAATTSVDGYLTSSDWNNFSNKQAPLSAGVTINGVTYPANATLPMQVNLAPVNLTDVVNKQYVDGFGQWLKSGGNIYRSSGNVGIGTNSPTYPLHVVGDIYSSGQVYASAFWVGTGGNFINAAATNEIGITTNNVDRVRIDSTGKVGVGTTAPSSKFHVSGGSITTAYGTSTTLANDFSTANVISTTAAAGTLVLNNMQDGTSYTLIVQNTGNYTLSGSSVSTWRCAPACPSGVVSNSTGHVMITILKAGTTGYVSYITDMQ